MITKVILSYDGRSSWLAYEDAIDDWGDITILDDNKRGLALRNRLEGLRDLNNGVKYLKNFLQPLFVSSRFRGC